MRSSFHQAVVARPGMRRSTSRASASAARRTSVKLQRGSMRRWAGMPRGPLALGERRAPGRLDAGVYGDAAGAARLGEAEHPVLVQDVAGAEGHLADLAPLHRGLRI